MCCTTTAAVLPEPARSITARTSRLLLAVADYDNIIFFLVVLYPTLPVVVVVGTGGTLLRDRPQRTVLQ